ncbi:GNAT family N-acetyltransferase [Streptacidiphilus jiangxiensis]|uniref:Acetyltransferase (GNAT) family protein n=1 Tax=Streptacidiphilus jiangxiensis TaxID=235985 RepID=A0A1H7ZSF7_STRJI|nr:GNAT family N-acetyltransferase [Streptacidiphilus jiangxiensis]SEM61380.1 Acetyltransferase (GNAT) family protein [Streptacidiphilus jiangxiensis]
MDEVRIEAVDLAEYAAAALDVQAVAFGLGPEEVALRLQIVQRHADIPGVRAFGALHDGVLVGFGYGMPNDRTHWWSTVIEPYLAANGHAAWLDQAFSVTELHVHPRYQGIGLGRALITTLCAASALPRSILSAVDRETPARALYRSLGYRDLARRVMFPNTLLPYAVMGAPLPLAATRPGGRPNGVPRPAPRAPFGPP